PPIFSLFPYTTLFRSSLKFFAAVSPLPSPLERGRSKRRCVKQGLAELRQTRVIARQRIDLEIDGTALSQFAQGRDGKGVWNDQKDRKSTRLNSSHVKI